MVRSTTLILTGILLSSLVATSPVGASIPDRVIEHADTVVKEAALSLLSQTSETATPTEYWTQLRSLQRALKDHEVLMLNQGMRERSVHDEPSNTSISGTPAPLTPAPKVSTQPAMPAPSVSKTPALTPPPAQVVPAPVVMPEPAAPSKQESLPAAPVALSTIPKDLPTQPAATPAPANPAPQMPPAPDAAPAK